MQNKAQWLATTPSGYKVRLQLIPANVAEHKRVSAILMNPDVEIVGTPTTQGPLSIDLMISSKVPVQVAADPDVPPKPAPIGIAPPTKNPVITGEQVSGARLNPAVPPTPGAKPAGAPAPVKVDPNAGLPSAADLDAADAAYQAKKAAQEATAAPAVPAKPETIN